MAPCFFTRGERINAIDNYGDLYFCNRSRFDSRLLGAARAKGVEVLLGDRAEAVDTASRTCLLRSSRKLRYRYLVGADGANSVVARSVTPEAFDKGRYAFAVQAEVQDWAGREQGSAKPEIHFGEVEWGYGWVFPKKNSCSIGLGGLYPKNRNIRQRFGEFYASRNSRPYEGALKGHFIPFGNYVRLAATNDIVLSDDAAGLVDPVTGEGIAHAIGSGHHAALAVISVLSGGKAGIADAYEPYFRQVTQEIDRANMIRNFLFSECSRGLFISALSRTRTMPNHFMDLLSGEITYRDLFSIIQQKVKKLFFW